MGITYIYLPRSSVHQRVCHDYISPDRISPHQSPLGTLLHRSRLTVPVYSSSYNCLKRVPEDVFQLSLLFLPLSVGACGHTFLLTVVVLMFDKSRWPVIVFIILKKVYKCLKQTVRQVSLQLYHLVTQLVQYLYDVRFQRYHRVCF